MLTAQLPLPEQPPPDQPAKIEPAAGAAVRVTVRPCSKLAEQTPPQFNLTDNPAPSSPAMSEETTPEPLPALAKVKMYVGSGGAQARGDGF